jgi:hypothetical protein
MQAMAGATAGKTIRFTVPASRGVKTGQLFTVTAQAAATTMIGAAPRMASQRLCFQQPTATTAQAIAPESSSFHVSSAGDGAN